MNQDAIRKALFTPCKTKEELDRWIRVFLNIRFPDRIVSEESNASPLDMIWSLYDKAVRNDTEGWKRVMTYANRFGGKTLAAAVLETVILLHTRRNIVHMAAIKDQSKKAQEYVKGFFYRPYLNDFVVGDNDTEVVVVSYMHKKTGIPVPEKEFDKFSPSKKAEYTRKENYVRIIVCTMQSTNGQHVELMVVDEVDVIPKGNLRAYDQAKNGVPTDRGDLEAMTLFTSTRKSRIGKVQEEIDNAAASGLVVSHWNIIDITEPCPTFRHRPAEPKVTLWINDGLVKHITEKEYERLPDTDKEKANYYAREGYAGCATCPLFAACKGALATKQTGKVGEFADGGTALLLKIATVIDKFKAATPEFITTEFMCRKPDTSGLVYPRYNPAIHKKTAAQIAEEVEGGPVPDITDKDSLLAYLVNKGVRFVSGMDFGYNHLFAVVTLAVWGNKAYVVDAIGLPHQELDDKLALSEHLKALNSTIFGDPEDPASIATFRRKGFRMREWTKGPGSVKGGIDIVRAKLYSKGVGATLFFLEGDGPIETLAKHVQDYHFVVGPDGKFTEEPDETNDDLPDALRYAAMNVFGKNGALRSNLGLVQVSEAAKEEHWTKKAERANRTALTNIVSALTNGSSAFGQEQTQLSAKKVKRGGFYWDG
jgi:hypothetical protein